MVAKSFPRKLVVTKGFDQNFLGRKFFLSLQNHFLENRFLPKNFLHFFCSKFFMVAKSFSRKLVFTKDFDQTFFGRKSFIVAKSFPPKEVPTKNFHPKFLV